MNSHTATDMTERRRRLSTVTLERTAVRFRPPLTLSPRGCDKITAFCSSVKRRQRSVSVKKRPLGSSEVKRKHTVNQLLSLGNMTFILVVSQPFRKPSCADGESSFHTTIKHIHHVRQRDKKQQSFTSSTAEVDPTFSVMMKVK